MQAIIMCQLQAYLEARAPVAPHDTAPSMAMTAKATELVHASRDNVSRSGDKLKPAWLSFVVSKTVGSMIMSRKIRYNEASKLGGTLPLSDTSHCSHAIQGALRRG